MSGRAPTLHETAGVRHPQIARNRVSDQTSRPASEGVSGQATPPDGQQVTRLSSPRLAERVAKLPMQHETDGVMGDQAPQPANDGVSSQAVCVMSDQAA